MSKLAQKHKDKSFAQLQKSVADIKKQMAVYAVKEVQGEMKDTNVVSKMRNEIAVLNTLMHLSKNK